MPCHIRLPTVRRIGCLKGVRMQAFVDPGRTFPYMWIAKAAVFGPSTRHRMCGTQARLLTNNTSAPGALRIPMSNRPHPSLRLLRIGTGALIVGVLCGLLTLRVSAQATIAFVQSASAVPQTAQSAVILAYPSAQTAGSLNVVVVGWTGTTTFRLPAV